MKSHSALRKGRERILPWTDPVSCITEAPFESLDDIQCGMDVFGTLVRWRRKPRGM